MTKLSRPQGSAVGLKYMPGHLDDGEVPRIGGNKGMQQQQSSGTFPVMIIIDMHGPCDTRHYAEEARKACKAAYLCWPLVRPLS